ncbi:hypothetical protein BGZ96_009457 [Linnemannia gamsii]|uniref:Extracellular membrane protein CFEM domain-containing protein n=1 Tax=Linnemannia gamsii TaxID=64522 RepID=A0ABQ7JX25_9FUNG|nr:hypothetical protein BGZ96_009457 [Linnemannia gamsii]
MTLSRFVLILALEVVLFLTVLTHTGNHVSAQFGLTGPCNDCLIRQIAALPTCVGVNLGNQTTPEYRTCLCDASFDFTWTNTCAASNNCQPNELTSFKNGFANNLLTGLNITCVKPTPSPTPAPTTTTTADTNKPTSPSAAVQLSIAQSAVLGWAVALSTVMAVLSVL